MAGGLPLRVYGALFAVPQGWELAVLDSGLALGPKRQSSLWGR